MKPWKQFELKKITYNQMETNLTYRNKWTGYIFIWLCGLLSMEITFGYSHLDSEDISFFKFNILFFLSKVSNDDNI